MRVTDEQVWAAVCAWRDVYDAEYMHSGSTMGNDEQAMRAALEAAISHAAWQEAVAWRFDPAQYDYANLWPRLRELRGDDNCIGDVMVIIHDIERRAYLPAVARSEGETKPD